MAENSKIAWTDHTHNFWIGCDEVSAACDFCYARELSERYGWAKWGPKEPRHRTSYSNWRKPFSLNRAAEKSGIRAKVFTNSLADFFDNKVDPSWRTEAWKIIRDTPYLDWLILTKRPQNIKKMIPEDWWPLPNVWLGTTAESQEEYDRRRLHLLKVPAIVHFFSVEPMLSPLIRDLANERGKNVWYICGGESGANRRELNMDWAESLRVSCGITKTPFFFKQDSHRLPGQRGRASDELWNTKQFPA